MGLLDLLRFSFSSLVWGILITVICLVLFFVLIRGWHKNATFTLISYLIGLVLFILLSFQCTLIMAAIKIVNISDFYASKIQQLMQHSFYDNQEVTLQQSQQIIEGLVDAYPVLGHFFQSGEFTGYTAVELPEAMRGEMCSFLRYFIFRRLLWCLAFVILGAIGVIWTLNPANCGYNAKRTYTSSEEIF